MYIRQSILKQVFKPKQFYTSLAEEHGHIERKEQSYFELGTAIHAVLLENKQIISVKEFLDTRDDLLQREKDIYMHNGNMKEIAKDIPLGNTQVSSYAMIRNARETIDKLIREHNEDIQSQSYILKDSLYKTAKKTLAKSLPIWNHVPKFKTLVETEVELKSEVLSDGPFKFGGTADMLKYDEQYKILYVWDVKTFGQPDQYMTSICKLNYCFQLQFYAWCWMQMNPDKVVEELNFGWFCISTDDKVPGAWIQTYIVSDVNQCARTAKQYINEAKKLLKDIYSKDTLLLAIKEQEVKEQQKYIMSVKNNIIGQVHVDTIPEWGRCNVR